MTSSLITSRKRLGSPITLATLCLWGVAATGCSFYDDLDAIAPPPGLEESTTNTQPTRPLVFEQKPLHYAMKTDANVTLDGKRDLAYDNVQSYTFKGNANVKDPNTVHVTSLWNEKELFTLYEVEDTVTFDDLNRGPWFCDTVELRLDPNRDQSDTLLEDDRLVIVNWARHTNNLPKKTLYKRGDTTINGEFGARHRLRKTEKGYNIEIAITWEELELAPRAEAMLGMNLIAGDCDSPEERHGGFSWIKGLKNFGVPSTWGALMLVE